MGKIKYCDGCGAERPLEHKFCTVCGEDLIFLSDTCVKCHYRLTGEDEAIDIANYCPMCGEQRMEADE